MAKEDIIKHQFQKGNKMGKGRPKNSWNREKIILDILKLEQVAVNPVTKKEETLNQYQLIVLAMLKKARAGDVRAAQWIDERGFGKLIENYEVNQTGESSGDLKDIIRAIRTTGDTD
tara:strand:- start:1235 stop:1585 length:351 start_codon:yes stop_codon:yes gene_type:complete